MRSLSRLIAGTALAAALCAAPLALAGEGANLTRSVLESGKIAEQTATLEAFAAGHAGDDEAIFGLGMAQFVGAVEKFGQAQYRHGLKRQLSLSVPMLRFPVPENPNAEVLTYAKQRQVLANFLSDLKRAEATLARIGTGEAKVPLDLGRITLDLTGTGNPGDEGRLSTIVARLNSPNPRQPVTDADRFTAEIAFDRADAIWLRGYCNLLSAHIEFLLAYDWSETFNLLAPRFYPKTDPVPAIATAARAGGQGVSGFVDRQSEAEITDLIALAHEIRWPLVEPARMPAAHAHLKQAIALSRENWKAIQAETDDEREWVPSPKQKNGVLPMPVAREQVDGWMEALDTFDKILDGKLLLPHWRFAKGINLKKVFLEPRRFDLVLWATGHDAANYLEDGPIETGATFRRLDQIFGGNFIGYAVWFN